MKFYFRLPRLLLVTILVSGLLGAIQVRADAAPLSQRLAQLSQADRQNARIVLQLAATAEAVRHAGRGRHRGGLE